MRDLDADIDLRLPELKRRERSFENALRDELKSRGVGFVKLKPTIKGFPDRLALGNGRAKLVEVKREGEEARLSQVARHRELKRKYDVDVLIVEGPDVKLAARRVIRALARENL
jgi:hypothetical protein